MTTTTTKSWESKRTEETRKVEQLLQQFKQADAYRYNSATIRVRVIDPRFEGLNRDARDAMDEEKLKELPNNTQRDIVSLFTFLLQNYFERQKPSGNTCSIPSLKILVHQCFDEIETRLGI